MSITPDYTFILCWWCTLFFDGSERSLHGILQILRRFYLVSGLDLNLRKSSVFLDGNNQIQTRHLATKFGVSRGSLPVRYLGLPLLPHKMRAQDYQPLLDKVTNRISSWTVRHLSFAGRLQLIQSILYSISTFGARFSLCLRVACLPWENFTIPSYGQALLTQQEAQKLLGLRSARLKKKVD